MKLLIVGGYGTFGGRIVQLLESESALTIVVAGRSVASARTFCASRAHARATLTPAYFDREGDLDAQLERQAPDLVIDASGPFQAYGGAAFRLIEACVRARIHYLDLADGSDFVAGVAAYDEAAREAGVYALSGVSSFPVLTAAVVRELTASMTRVDDIAGGIAPSPYAGVGANVVRAIASYAGQPVAYLGRTAKIIGRPFTQQRRYTIAPAGRLPLRSTMFSLVDVPDLRALSELWPQVRRVWMGAGPVPEILHRALIFCAWLVAIGAVRSLSPLAPLMHWATNRLRWGEHRGGMFVEVQGADAEGAPVTRSWHLLAEGADGPLIPSMAVQAIVLKHLAGAPPRPGARACVDDVELKDYERLFVTRTIYTGVRTHPPRGAFVYQRILGAAWEKLPPALREMHDGVAFARGRGRVERGRNPLAWFAASVLRFPRAGEDLDVSVRFDPRPAGEVWTRSFANQSFSSYQYEGRGASERLIVERFGVLAFSMALVLEGERLNLVLRRWSAFGVVLPLWLAPRSKAHESADGDVFHFFVEISHPLVGLIVRYQGWLTPQPPGPRTE
ncbi:SDR family oxidoreductase [Terricaulis sp.]|uniref:SDR family oxidoreductase n=1 Tax=Terricaulis sp. TaxID=2768686 RepID=UPI002AC4C9D5|nr:DUF4166 domain-containing protein [Terricaulis sp.]MDZ4691637.1 DUF4166 domain-containing protein [Terricaulis sp.]